MKCATTLAVCLIFTGLSVLLKTQKASAQNYSPPIIAGEPIDAGDLPAVIPNEEFIREKIWPELVRLTEADKDLKIPKVIFLNKDGDGRMGRYFGDRIEIYRFGVFKQLLYWYDDPKLLPVRELNIRIYGVVAHELLHHIYQHQGMLDPAQNHKKMYEDKTAMSVCRFLEKELISDGIACIDTEANLKYLVENKK